MQMNLKLACATVVLLTLWSGAALANHACHDDAFKFCHTVIPDHKLIQHCLQRNKFHLTPACRAHFR
jgi:hypothetical protein